MNRRTVRRFVQKYEISKENLESIIKSEQYGPRTKDVQGGDFVVIKYKETIDKIADIVIENIDDSMD